MTRDRFVDEMLRWLDRHFGHEAAIAFQPDTDLFDAGRIDSIRILELIAWTERAIDRVIPDEQIRMDNFSTVARIADVFVREEPHVAA